MQKLITWKATEQRSILARIVGKIAGLFRALRKWNLDREIRLLQREIEANRAWRTVRENESAIKMDELGIARRKRQAITQAEINNLPQQRVRTIARRNEQ